MPGPPAVLERRLPTTGTGVSRRTRRPPDADGAAEDADEDRRAFEAAMAGAKPVDRRRARLVLPPPRRDPAVPAGRRAREAARGGRDSDGEDQARGPGGDRVIRTVGEESTIAASGIDRRVLRELRADGARPELTLDLHGLRREAALRSLELFLARARASGKRRVLVIHGRGLGSGGPGPVLRQAVLESLASGACAPLVLAAVSAAPRLGGPGATMVLLRK